jgi:hypothetical protein
MSRRVVKKEGQWKKVREILFWAQKIITLLQVAHTVPARPTERYGIENLRFIHIRILLLLHREHSPSSLQRPSR